MPPRRDDVQLCLENTGRPIYAECEASYLGTIRVSLDAFDLENVIVDEKKLAALKTIFRAGLCDRTNPRNNVEGVVTARTYSNTRRDQNDDSDLRLVQLAQEINQSRSCIQVLHGGNRLLAADDYFSSKLDRWWAVRLYAPSKCSMKMLGAERQSCTKDEYMTYTDRSFRGCNPSTSLQLRQKQAVSGFLDISRIHEKLC